MDSASQATIVAIVKQALRYAAFSSSNIQKRFGAGIFYLSWLLFALVLAGCQALASEKAQVPIDANATIFVLEMTALQRAIDLDQARAAATLSAGGTRVAALSQVNAALGATLQAALTPTTEIRAMIVNAADMGSSLEQDMMDDMPENESDLSTMRIVDLATARAVNASSGCSAGTVSRFNSGNERIYVTARVEGLRPDTYFEVDWRSGERVLYRVSWRATYAAAAECIWFFATPVDFPFLPGNYRATLFVDGQAHSSTDFSISA